MTAEDRIKKAEAKTAEVIRAAREAIASFENISWDWDDDCGSSYVIDYLETQIDKIEKDA